MPVGTLLDAQLSRLRRFAVIAPIDSTVLVGEAGERTQAASGQMCVLNHSASQVVQNKA